MKIRLSASKADRWMNCTESVFREKDIPDTPPGFNARIGSAAHRIAEALLENKIPSDKVSSEMYDFVNVYLDAINKERSTPNSLLIEKKFEISFTSDLTVVGIPDIVIMKEKEIVIADFKYGHRVVEVVENWQLLTYAILLSYEYKINPNFKFMIVQPRAAHTDGAVREWYVSDEKMLEYACQFRDIIAQIQKGPTGYKDGDWCRYCKVVKECPKLIETMKEIEKKTTVPIDYGDPEITSQELDKLHALFNLLKIRLEAYESYAIETIQKGTPIPGWGFEPGRGSLSWCKSIKEVIELGKEMGVDLQKPTTVITPTQAKAKGIPEEVLKKCTVKNLGKMKLSKVNMKKAQQIFGGE